MSRSSDNRARLICHRGPWQELFPLSPTSSHAPCLGAGLWRNAAAPRFTRVLVGLHANSFGNVNETEASEQLVPRRMFWVAGKENHTILQKISHSLLWLCKVNGSSCLFLESQACSVVRRWLPGQMETECCSLYTMANDCVWQYLQLLILHISSPSEI